MNVFSLACQLASFVPSMFTPPHSVLSHGHKGLPMVMPLLGNSNLKLGTFT